MEQLPEKRYPANPKDYKLYEEIGEGVSATVYRALCVPLNEIVAIKVLDLEKCNNDLDGIRREVQTMSLINHQNLLRAHCSFTADQSLWVVMPYMAEGSCLHIMKTAYPDGFEEPVIATLLHEVLKALVYLHGHGHIHRDVKAGNILVDTNGAVKLADFGVSACMFDTGDRQRSRNTFVGTPCWMAPEVMQQLHGYDFKADIWSFGITALELAHGHAPFSKYPPMKVLLMTLQNAPPGLDYERDKRFSKSFKDLVGNCLVKDPKKRPSSEKIMKHPFFKHARSNDYLTRTILDGLPPLGQRFRALKDKEAEFLLENKQLGDKEHLSQQEYIRGISAWNFNLEDLKTQAALIQDPGGISNTDDSDTNKKHNDGCDEEDFASKLTSSEKDEFHDLQTVEGSLTSTFPVHSLQALKGCFDVFEGEEDATSPILKKPDTESMFQLQSSSQVENSDSRLNNGVVLERKLSSTKSVSAPGQRPRFLSGPLMSELGVSSKKVVGDGERGEMLQKNQSEGNYSGTLFYRQMKEPIAANVHELEEGAEGRYVQHKGRFKVTSADINAKGTSTTNCSANTGASTNSTITPASILPSLQYMLQQNNMQREQIIKLIRSMEQMSGQNMELSDARSSDLLQVPATSRERELQAYMATLQQSTWNLVEELRGMKIRNTQLEQQLNDLTNKENDKLQNKHKEASR